MGTVTWSEFGITIPRGRMGEWDTTCPKCSAQRKKKTARCLSVNIDAGTFLCHHCGWTGGLGIGQQIGQLAWRKPVWRRPEPQKEVAKEPAIEWFGSRGIPPEVVERNKIIATTVYMPQVEERRGVVAFPYYRDGELINYKYRDREKNFRMEAQAERILYGYDDIDDNACMVVEGEMDKLTAEVAGIVSCVSVPDGAPTPETKNYASKFTFLDDERLQRVQKWVIAVDNDPPGVRLEQELVRRLGIERCLKVTYPDGCKDLNDVLGVKGSDAVKNLIAAATPYPIAGIFEVKDLAAQIDLLYKQGLLKGLSTGYRNLDEFYSVRAGQFTIVTGTPSSGKSNFIDALMVNLAKEHAWKFGICSPENQPIENHISRLMEHFTKLPFRSGPTTRMDEMQMTIARDWANEFFKFILPPEDTEWTVDNILKLALILIRRHGINGLVIDPWNELDHVRPAHHTETEYISGALKKIRQFARRHAVHIWLVAHPQKLYRSRDTGQYPTPTLYDINGGAHFRNKADCGLIIVRDFADPENPIVEVHTAKIRFKEIGKLGVCSLKYDKATGGYSEANPVPLVDPPDDTDTGYFWEK